MHHSHRAALAAGVALGALSLTSAAFAQCAPESGGVIECAAGSYDAIRYTGQTDVELRLAGDIFAADALLLSGAGDLSITAAAGSTIQLGTDAYAVLINNAGLNSRIALDEVRATNGWAGIAVFADQGAIDITANRVVASGIDAPVGVRVWTTAAQTTIDVGTIEQNAGSLGVDLITDSGDAVIAVDAILLSEGGLGVGATSGSGDLTLRLGDILMDESIDGYGYGGLGVSASTLSGDIDLSVDRIIGGEEAGGVYLGSESGDVTVVAGAISVGGGFGGTGIWVSTASGAIDITAGSVGAGGEAASGIIADSTSGDIRIRAVSASTYEGSGIGAFSETGDIDVTTRSASSGEGYAVHLITQGAVSLEIEAGGRVKAGYYGVYVGAGEGATVVNHGLIDIDDFGSLSAVDVAFGAIDLTNEGRINGGVHFAEGDDIFRNPGVWAPFAGSDFGDGDDILINAGAIRPLHYYDDPTFGWFSAETYQIVGLERLENAGLIDLSGGAAGDHLTISGTYVGLTGARLAVDFSPSEGLADQIVFGAVEGQSALTVVRTGEDGGFSEPIAVVTAETPMDADAVILDPDSATSGLTQIALAYDADDNAFTLQALPSEAALANLRLGWAAQDYASKSGEAWSGRLEDLRDSVWAGVGRSGAVEAWGQGVWGERRQDQVSDFTVLDTTIRRDISSSSDWRGLQIGADRAFGPMLLGVTGGFLDYDMGMGARPDSFGLKGFNLGAYAALMHGPFSLSALAKVDRFEARAVLLSVGDDSDLDGVAYDAQIEAAWRFGGGAVFIEPVVSADFIRAELDDLEVAGATAAYADLDSLRLRAGLRAGGRMTRGAYVLTPTAGLYVTDERLGENVMDFTLGASGFSVTDHPYDAHGRADIGLGIVGPQGLAAYAKAEIDFGDGAEGATMRIGARWSW